MRTKSFGFAVGLVLLVGCGALGGSKNNNAPPANDAPPVDALTDPNHPGLEACRGSISAGDLDDALEIASDFKLSCHEMVVCGGLSASLSTTLISVLINAAAGSSTGPSSFTFDGKGTYATNNIDAGTSSGGNSMEIQLYLGADTSFGKAGDLIAFNVFDVATYFTGAKITATAHVDTSGNSSSSLSITFTNPGPGIELLGLGANPQSPINIDSGAIAAALGKIQLATKVHVLDTEGHTNVHYELTSPNTTIGAIANGSPLPMSLVSVTAQRGDTMQTIKVTGWTMRYVDTSASGYLDGTIGFEVDGGKLPYKVTFNYPRRKEPDVSLGCL